jgi:hypothetical protein
VAKAKVGAAAVYAHYVAEQRHGFAEEFGAAPSETARLAALAE